MQLISLHQLLLRIALGTLLFFAAGAAKAQGFLHARGTSIVDGSGKPFLLRGMGLGGWMLQEGYMFRLSNLGQQYRIREKIQDLVGPEKTGQFYQQWLARHTTRKDIDSMAAWGFNSIRLPMHYALFTLPVEQEPVAGQNTWLETGFRITDSLLSWCAANKMYLILDMHAAPGGQGHDLPISDRDASKPSLWESVANRNKMVALWKKLAARYVNEPWIGGYDIINEPNWSFTDTSDVRGIHEKNNQPLRELMMDITKAIRTVDTHHIIIVEGNGFGNNYQGVDPDWDDNLVLSFHKYGNFNNDESIRNFLELRERFQHPLWMGESGENANTWFTEAVRLVESHGIGWAWWQEKKMGISNPFEIIAPAGYETLRAYWSGKGTRPSPEFSWNVLAQLLENFGVDKMIFHRDVVDALFREVHETTAIPFQQHRIENNSQVAAVDYDLGGQRVGYYDVDSCRYQYTAGVNTEGNRGYRYRNDGVDIAGDSTGVFVMDIEPSEWLQYSVQVTKAHKWKIALTTRGNAGEVELWIAGKKAAVLPLAAQPDWHATFFALPISLPAGLVPIRLVVKKGGFQLKDIQFLNNASNSK